MTSPFPYPHPLKKEWLSAVAISSRVTEELQELVASKCGFTLAESDNNFTSAGAKARVQLQK